MSEPDDYIETRKAQVVHERQSGFHEGAGPWEAGKVGFRIGSRVFWTGSYCHPGSSDTYNLDVVLATEIVKRWNQAS